MRANMHLTIQDYFRLSGHQLHDARLKIERNMTSHDPEHSFARILEGKQSSSVAQQHGLTIRDYLARPVAIQPQISVASPEQAGQENISRSANQSPVEDIPARSDEAEKGEVSPSGTDQQNGSAANNADRIEDSIASAARRYNLPKALVRAVIKAESGFQVRAVSPAGAQGLMQLMPATARELGVTDPFDIDQNIDGGAKYLRAMLNRFGGDVKLALSAYNAGPGTVARYDGNVPYAETRNYVDRVLRFARRST